MKTRIIFLLAVKANIWAISSDTRQLQFLKLHHFELERFISIVEFEISVAPRLTWSAKSMDSTDQKLLAAYARASRDVFHACLQIQEIVFEFIKMQHSCHHIDTIRHPNPSYVTSKLYGMSTCAVS